MIRGEIMKDEIKEILLIIKSCKQDYDKQKNGMHTFDYGELYLLYDYITNLQQEKDNLYLDNTMLKMEKDIYKQGYEELKELIEKTITEVN